jgi:hypothetical protein
VLCDRAAPFGVSDSPNAEQRNSDMAERAAYKPWRPTLEKNFGGSHEFEDASQVKEKAEHKI